MAHPHPYMMLLVLALAATAMSGAAAQGALKAAQTAALLQLKAALAPQVKVKGGWTANTDFCKWNNPDDSNNPNYDITPTIKCDKNGLVQEISELFDGEGLPQWKGQLDKVPVAVWSALAPSLTSLIMRNNHLSGTLPASLSVLSRLEYLDFGFSNKLGGPLPDKWSALRALKELKLDNTAVTGTLPASWSKLTQLQSLDLQSNDYPTIPEPVTPCKVTGSLPASWSAMKALTSLSLTRCSLTGTLPASWGAGLAKLETLLLDYNQIRGTLPEAWKALGAAGPKGNGKECGGIFLLLNNNRLRGSLPSSWSELNLRYLDLSFNKLSGVVPKSWKKLQDLFKISACGEGEGSQRGVDLSNNAIA